MARLNEERQKRLEPERIKYATEKIAALGFDVSQPNAREIQFIFKGCLVRFFSYSGWHSGKSIKDGRGLVKLLKQIKLSGND